MCGTNGLFVGCPALAFCPFAQAPEAVECSETEYASPFRQWEGRAAVRTAPRRTLADGFTAVESFPAALVPTLNHPVTADLNETARGYLIAQQLYRYLDFTARLEHLVVNRTVMGIAHGQISVEVPQEMRFDAFRIYVDEGYHALAARDLADQVSAATGIEPNLPQTPAFILALHEVMSDYPEHEALIELLFVIVSETLITGNLAKVASSDEIAPAVASSVRDHASDEGRHHSYFRQFLRILWGQLGPVERRVATQVYARLVVGFTTPERGVTMADLVSVGVDHGDARDAIQEMFDEARVRDAALLGAARSLDYFADLQARDPAQELIDRAQLASTERVPT